MSAAALLISGCGCCGTSLYCEDLPATLTMQISGLSGTAEGGYCGGSFPCSVLNGEWTLDYFTWCDWFRPSPPGYPDPNWEEDFGGTGFNVRMAAYIETVLLGGSLVYGASVRWKVIVYITYPGSPYYCCGCTLQSETFTYGVDPAHPSDHEFTAVGTCYEPAWPKTSQCDIGSMAVSFLP